MSALKIAATDAMNEGADLWVLENDPESFWWKRFDFSSNHLLTQNYLYNKKIQPPLAHDCLLLGTKDHFKNSWILLWSYQNRADCVASVEKAITSLKIQSVRFFSDSGFLVSELEARPLASSVTISYIENT